MPEKINFDDIIGKNPLSLLFTRLGHLKLALNRFIYVVYKINTELCDLRNINLIVPVNASFEKVLPKGLKKVEKRFRIFQKFVIKNNRIYLLK